MNAVTAREPRRRAGGWERTLLRWLEWVSCPALAGAAFCVLSLGIVTWLPALAAAGLALRRWRTDGDQRCFVGVFEGFRAYWGRLWRHSLLSVAAGAVLAANCLFLVLREAPIAFALLAVQVGIAAALIPYHLALAAVAATRSDDSVARWRRSAVVLAFGGWRGPVLLVVAVATIAFTLPLGVGPFLFGPTVPLLLALAFVRRLETE